MSKSTPRLVAIFVGLALFGPGAPVRAAEFSIDEVLSAPFASSLTASPTERRVAWVANRAGRRNVWLASAVAGATGFASRALTHFDRDDGQDVADLAFVPRHPALVFVRGGDFEDPDKPPPNPAHDPAGTEQALYLVGFDAGPPIRLATGHAPVATPAGDRILYLRKGEVFAIAPRAGAKEEQLFKARGEQTSLRVAPDGRRVAFVSQRGDHSFIGIYSFATHALSFLDGGFGYDTEPRWSPDGARLAFLRLPSTHDEVGIGPHATGAPWSIRVANPDDGRSVEVFRAPRGRGSVFHPLGSEAQIVWTADQRLVFPMEADGWLHLYAVAAGGGEVRLLTPGGFEVEYATASADGSRLVFASNAGDIDRRHIWQLSFPGGTPEPLSAGSGIETMPVLLGDGRTVAVLRADAQLPMHPAVIGAGGLADLDGEPIPARFPGRSFGAPESVLLPARGGIAAHAQLFAPAGDAGRRRPAIIFMHGGPIRQMLAGWHYMDYYSNAYALNQYLASRGFVVLALNYRSGIGYGLDFREAAGEGSAGASEYQDLLAAADYLHSRPDVDAGRIGLWGGSYGGYMTALGLARNSDLFRAGVDIHGVHDWHHWSLEYRAGRPFYPLDVPASDLATSLAASPVGSLATWRSPVLLIHGDDDRNVAFSESVRLAESLRAQGVEYEELVLPDEIHDFLRHASWLRVYRATAAFLEAKLGR